MRTIAISDDTHRWFNNKKHRDCTIGNGNANNKQQQQQ